VTRFREVSTAVRLPGQDRTFDSAISPINQKIPPIMG
jgi:hypothetical protein